MPLQVFEVTDPEDFQRLIAVEYAAYQTPFNSFWQALKGPSVEECAVRQWSWHKGTAGSRWLKVVDTDTGEIIGGTEWIIHETNPFAKETPMITATWWPEGALKDITDQMLKSFFGRRPARMSRPHLLISICFVAEGHRRRGAGRLMVDWGCQLADKLELECFVESTEDGRTLYESAGFHAVDAFTLDAKKDAPSSEWIKLKHDMIPSPQIVWFMWRPKGGKFEPGKTKYSWEE